MSTLAERLENVRARITRATKLAKRPLDSVQLLPVSKTQPIEVLRAAIGLGLTEFGENYLQEALDKIQNLPEHITWHFIGPMQSNKTRDIATYFQWVHSVDRLKIAQRLSEQRPGSLPPLNICLQVNISRESSKSGVLPEDALAVSQVIMRLPNICLRGLMAIPVPETDTQRQGQAFRALRELLIEINSRTDLQMDTLSMGMSNDLEAAIAQGATIVRIGTDIFGARTKSR